ncbi:MAG: hypothetical protein ACM3WV_10765 [Bacillota bacterium]
MGFNRKKIFLQNSGGKYPPVKGLVILDMDNKCLHLFVRGLPEPVQFGRDKLTGQKYNVYEAWLFDGRKNRFISAGWLRKVNRISHLFYRSSNLGNYNAILITAQDRMGSVSPTPAVVLQGDLIKGFPDLDAETTRKGEAGPV